MSSFLINLQQQQQQMHNSFRPITRNWSLQRRRIGSDLLRPPCILKTLSTAQLKHISGVVVPYYIDTVAIGAFGTSDAEIFVSASTRNGGPEGLTVTNVAPCVTTVGGGNIDRDFPANIKLENGKIISVVNVYGGPALVPLSLAFFGDI
ncbi:Uncharacterized protein Fot_21806 [Forsythia ovata]|uniref:Uncharacterized protein n=1 Tax=Forsythia ovata TaxID=205694 RepID=A0ABD1UXJ0_9LAMI